MVLTFTLPQQTVDRRPLKELPAIEIYRGFPLPVSPPSVGANKLVAMLQGLVVTIPRGDGRKLHDSRARGLLRSNTRVHFLDQERSGDLLFRPDSRVREKIIGRIESCQPKHLCFAQPHHRPEGRSDARRHRAILVRASEGSQTAPRLRSRPTAFIGVPRNPARPSRHPRRSPRSLLSANRMQLPRHSTIRISSSGKRTFMRSEASCSIRAGRWNPATRISP